MRGLCNVKKGSTIFSIILKAQKASIFCLQETYASPEDEKLWSAEWGGKIIFAQGTTHSKGVRILLNPNSPLEEKRFFITNIYAPNNCHDQDDFIRTLSEKLMSKTDTSKVFISGDWNITLNQIDKRGGLPWKVTSGKNTLIDLVKELNNLLMIPPS